MFVENLTILMPVYNGGTELSRALKSLSRLKDNTNIILYNDGSEDDTLSSLSKFSALSNHRVKVLNSKKNRGYLRAIAILFRLCKTDYFLVHGHDDEVSENFLDQLDDEAIKNRDHICYFTRTLTVASDGSEVGYWPRRLINKTEFLSSELIANFRRFECGNLFIGIWSKKVMNHTHVKAIYHLASDHTSFKRLKGIGFLNDHMLVMKALSDNNDATLAYNPNCIYKKWLSAGRSSEGANHASFENILNSPLRYNAAIALFMIPQINQPATKIIWYAHAIFLLWAVALKQMASRPSVTILSDLFSYSIAITQCAIANKR
ncbi:glycosyltransferase [bacterium]|nr:glycosyltransferase [bacterium]